MDMRSYLLSAEQEAADLVPVFEIPMVYRASAWLDEPEARFDLSDDDEQSYGLRFRPRSFGERSVERTIHHLEIQRLDLKYESIFNDALKKRYMMLIDILAHQEETNYLNQEADLLYAKRNFSRNLVQTTAFDPEQLEAFELELFQLKQQAKLSSARLQTMITQVGFAVNKMSALLASRSDWLIPLSELVDTIAQGNDQADEAESNLRVLNNYTDLRIAQEDLKLARKKNNSFFKFIELNYTDKQNSMSEVRLSFAISLGGSQSGFLGRELDVHYAQSLLLKGQLETTQFLQQKYLTIHWLFDQSKMIQHTIDDINLRMSRRQKVGNPRLVLLLKQERLRQERKLWDTRHQAMRAYIESLHLSGQLVKQPLQNWLRVGRPYLKGDSE